MGNAKALILAAFLAPVTGAEAAPYFKPALNAIKPGIFQPMTGAGARSLESGFVIPIIVHDKADGYWIVPGITWNLLDAGYSQEGGNKALRLGPSINLDEPVKAVLRKACAILPGWGDDFDRYKVLRGLFASADKDSPAALALGPAGRLTVPTLDPKTWRGGVDWAVTLNARF